MFEKFFKKEKNKDGDGASSFELLSASKTGLKAKKGKCGNKEVGEKGEKIAQEYLVQKGYKILEANRRFSRLCEIDIIALEKDTLVFVEVKTRSSDFCGSGFEAITKSKYENIKTGLFTYLQENPKYKKFRIDAISIILKPGLKISHLKNI